MVHHPSFVSSGGLRMLKKIYHIFSPEVKDNHTFTDQMVRFSFDFFNELKKANKHKDFIDFIKQINEYNDEINGDAKYTFIRCYIIGAKTYLKDPEAGNALMIFSMLTGFDIGKDEITTVVNFKKISEL